MLSRLPPIGNIPSCFAIVFVPGAVVVCYRSFVFVVLLILDLVFICSVTCSWLRLFCFNDAKVGSW
jgi:hypothetical protein